MILDEGGYHEGRRLAEVYNHPQPPPRIEIAAIEPLTPRRRIVFMDVRTTYSVEHCLLMAEHLWSPPGEVALGPCIEDDTPPAWIFGLTILA